MKDNTTKIGEFTGAFGGFARNWYYDLTAFGMAKSEAHRIAMDAMADLGQAMASGDADVCAKIGKAKKDGTSEFKFGGKSERKRMTPAMSLIRVAQQLAALKAEKLIVNCDVLSSLEYTDSIAAYAGNNIEVAPEETANA